MVEKELNIQVEYCQYGRHIYRAACTTGEASHRAESLKFLPNHRSKFHTFNLKDLVASHQQLPDAHLLPKLQKVLSADSRV